MPPPTLPKINGDVDIVLDLYTHRSLRFGNPPLNNDYGDIDRLVELGQKVLQLAVTIHYYNETPLLACQELTASANKALSDDTIQSWAEQYDLRNKIRFNPQDVQLRTEDYRRFFYSYVGALYCRSGMQMQEVQKWISSLINPAHTHNYNSYSQSPAPPLPPGSPPPPMPPPPLSFPSSSPNASLITLALVNQTAVQKGCTIGYQAEPAGPPHQPIWTVVCLINGVEKGRGIGKTQKLGKEEAARQAYLAMGW